MNLREILVLERSAVCELCGGAECGNEMLDPDHAIFTKAATRRHFKGRDDPRNLILLGRFPCHAEKPKRMYDAHSFSYWSWLKNIKRYGLEAMCEWMAIVDAQLVNIPHFPEYEDWK